MDLARYEAEEKIAQVMYARVQAWLRKEGLNMERFLALDEAYEMNAFELLLCVMLEIESTIGLLKKDSKYYSHRGKDGEMRYTVNPRSLYPTKPL